MLNSMGSAGPRPGAVPQPNGQVSARATERTVRVAEGHRAAADGETLFANTSNQAPTTALGPRSVMLAIRADPEKMLRKGRETESGEKAEETEATETIEATAEANANFEDGGAGSHYLASSEEEEEEEEDDDEDASLRKTGGRPLQ